MTISISGLMADEGTGPFRTPSGAIDVNGTLYMFYVTQVQDAEPHYALKSILAKADQPAGAWSDSTPPTFTRLQTVSSHPPIADPANLPPEETDYGKFMFNSPVVMDASAVSAFGLTQLPAELQTASKIAFVFGSSWRYNRSNLYLAAFSLADIEAGPAKWFYFTGLTGGAATWSTDEKLASPLIPGLAAVGNHSVVWNPALNSFILMYGNIVCRFAPTPWSAWSDPILVLTPQSDWASKLLHHPGLDSITRSIIPIYNSTTGNQVNLDGDATGIPYSPYLIDKYTQNPDGSVTVYFAMSGWDPYQVWLMSSTFIAGSSSVPTSKRALPQLAFGGGWYTGLYFYNSNSTPVTVAVRPLNAAGQPLASPDAGQTGATLGIVPKGTALLEFPNRGTLRQGWAEVDLPDGVTGYGVFRQSVPGRTDQEAVVPLTPANQSTASLVFDDTAFTTSVAFANPSDSESTVTHIARDSSGQVIGTSTVDLLPKGRQALELRTIVPGVAGKRGSVQSIASPGVVSALGLRFNSPAFTSIPVEGAVVPLDVAALPQIAFGGGWYTALQFFNTTDAPVSVNLAFFDGNGQPLTVPGAGGSEAVLNLAAKGTTVFEMPNTGALQQGWARANLPGGVIGYGVFRQSAAGRPDQEAVVLLTKTTSPLSTLIFDDIGQLTTAVAFVNPTSSVVTVNISVLDETGLPLGSAAVQLGPNARQASVLKSLLPQIAGKRGSVQFSAGAGAVSVIGLRFSTAAFTSIPADSN